MFSSLHRPLWFQRPAGAVQQIGFPNSPDHGEIVYDVNNMNQRQPNPRLNVIGGLLDHSNVAVFGKDETNVKDLLKCEDFKQLTV